ncbi:MAG: DNA-directed RNA polymerase subunit beta' [Dehalococcoidia bacterium]
MLEVNDFNAVRISLASPSQIRSWSYGEVTKPETINYRTLKPEKDGLFCEKIFGPTKDFECYCGKYKRVRYKGIKCDKCGVEVARSKVRRERMGHIELASPVSHIWFVKGTPSRLGLLLDISPRSLERVLYFAQYIIVSVNEDERQRRLAEISAQMEEEVAKATGEIQAQITAEREAVDMAVEEFESDRRRQLDAIEGENTEALARLDSEHTAVTEQLAGRVGEASGSAVVLGDVTVIGADEMIKPTIEDEIRKAYSDQKDQIEARIAQRRQDVAYSIDAARDQRKAGATSIVEPLVEKKKNEETAIREKFTEQIDELTRDIQPLRLVPETKYRDWTDRYSTVFKAEMGAEAVLHILEGLDMEDLRTKLHVEVNSTSGQRRKKATKRLRVVEALKQSGNEPSWMIFTVLPVLPPDLRPMVQLDGGRFATSDLNDLYRRVINRNNRLNRLLTLGAPEIIIRNEKRMLQEAVDSLIDNGRRGRAVSGSGNHKLKSLSDMLKGKQGRFRQNLLGKRVDYSGRSVIVVGPELKLHQCGLPKRMALELFKPFVMHALVARGLAHNIKSAKRFAERARPEVWDVLDEVIRQRPVLLNRAPTLHRLGIQAFEPVLIDGSAIQLHPLVCLAFNADFDGDQMAVHVPLSREAVAEARQVMMSTKNLLSPSSGEPVVAPRLDMVLGCFYLTGIDPFAKGRYEEGERADGSAGVGRYGSFAEVILTVDLRMVDLRAEIMVRDAKTNNEEIKTTPGRIIFNGILPEEIEYKNALMDGKNLKAVVAECYKKLGPDRTVEVVDAIKTLGFTYATRSGITMSIHDVKVPKAKAELLREAEDNIALIDQEFQMGNLTEEERYTQAIDIWNDTTTRVTAEIQKNFEDYGSVYMMANSGAKGNIAQIRQMAGMRGLMTDPSGRIIDLPIRSSFREGLTVLEYFISTHGARKGLADTALRTADSGYLTRRLIDVAQDVIVLLEDCETLSGIWLSEPNDKSVMETFQERVIGRYAAQPFVNEETGEIIIDRDEEIDEEKAELIVTEKVRREQAAKAAGEPDPRVAIYSRSPLTCEARRGICRLCYGRSLARGTLVRIGEAVGIIAAQSIGEPGTQLTMRTFHLGGVAGGLDITSGLPRVEELFEARVPKGEAKISEIDGVVAVTREGEQRKVRVTNTERYHDDYDLPAGIEPLVQHDQWVESGTPLARSTEGAEPTDTALAEQFVARMAGRIVRERGDLISVVYEEKDEREYPIAAQARLLVEDGSPVHAGDKLTEGSKNPQDVLAIQGREAVQMYLVEEVQKVYRSQGVNINDKHIETIARQMLRKVIIDQPGDTGMLPGELIDRFVYEDRNAGVLAEGGEPATAKPVLLGVTKASLSTDSFLAAASFQETTRVLTEAAITGRTDHLMGLKENVIIGKLIPARAELDLPPVERLAEPRPRLFQAFEDEDITDLEFDESDGLLGAEDGVPAIAKLASLGEGIDDAEDESDDADDADDEEEPEDEVEVE